MPCFRPLDCWRQPGSLKPGEARIVFSRHDQAAQPLTVPCGQCIGCRLERSRRWAVRLMHENQMHERSSFLTLTYDDDHVPLNGSLKFEDFQLFMKRLRRGSSGPLRFFHCGEYGERTSRPHYHCILFGEDFSGDRVFLKKNGRGESLYSSRRLCELWEKGALEQQTIGDVSFESAAYVARYCLKKVTGPGAEAHYAGRAREYVTMSRRPGIGAGWFEKFSSDVYPSDSVVVRGREMLPPPFYDRLLEKVDPALFARVKRERRAAGPDTAEYEVWREFLGGERLAVKEEVKSQTVRNALKRSI